MKACLFDIDGTLVQTGGAGQVAFAETFAAEFGVDQLTDSIAFAGRSDRAIAMDLFAVHGVDATELTWKKFQAAYLSRLDAALEGCTGEVLPGVTQLIELLHARGDVLIGLLTGNIRIAAEKKLSYYELWRHFENGEPVVGGFGDHHTDRNDIAATAVAEARSRHGKAVSDAETVVIIGDTPNDIRCAHSVGAKAVAVPTGFTPADELRTHNPDLLLDTLEDSEELTAWFDD
ncbi:MAG: haloacid dehalogenase-like hydrolase [Planctomycetota bacterium]